MFKLLKLTAVGLFLTSAFTFNAQAESLAGSEWGNEKPVEQFIKFSEGGKVTGHAGCNQFFGSAQIGESSGKIKFSPLASTRKACDQSVMQAEFSFLKALENSRTYKRSAKYLELYDDKGDLLTRLSWRDFD